MIFRIRIKTVISFIHLKLQSSLAVSVLKGATLFVTKRLSLLIIKENLFSLVSSVS